MKQNKKTVPAELSYYGLYLLDYLRKYHPDKVIDIEFITGREEAASETFEKERAAGSTVEAAQEEAMRVLLEGYTSLPTHCCLRWWKTSSPTRWRHPTARRSAENCSPI